jgi:hypothetical protein
VVRRGSLRIWLAIITAFLVGLAPWSASAKAADSASAYAVEASYLSKFAAFVEWPPSAFDSPTAPLTICISGQDPFGHMLDEKVRGQHVNDHPLMVRHDEAIRSGMPCHILYVGGDASEEALRAIQHEPVLTVTNHDEAGGGGMIQFMTVAGRVRFTINQAAAEESGITISSKLLELAVPLPR